ncbi:MAG: hypothetical protein H7338_24335 [Candidatus Sericytochromatia bacterium]|nr:hypothetical protein [Candidatus Sericytochromatia bacterium]
MDLHYLELGDGPVRPPAAGVLDYFDLCRIGPPVSLLRRFPLAFCDRHRWLPLHETEQPNVGWLPTHVTVAGNWGPGAGRILYVAMENPADLAALQAIAMRSGRRLQAITASAAALDRFFAERYPGPSGPKCVVGLI